MADTKAALSDPDDKRIIDEALGLNCLWVDSNAPFRKRLFPPFTGFSAITSQAVGMSTTSRPVSAGRVVAAAAAVAVGGVLRQLATLFHWHRSLVARRWT